MFFLTVFALLSNPAVEQEFIYEIQQSPDDSVVVTACFMGYSLGDYYHAAFTWENGDLFTAWAPTARNPGLGVFLFQHRGDIVEVTIVNVLTYVWEAGDSIMCPTVMDASTPLETYSQWYERISEEFGITTNQEFSEHFGEPEFNEPLFIEYEYLQESEASYRQLLLPE
ncbi:MAG: hypothetical protein U9P42_07120 [Candidatus Fermentibacteria bacterium]|nr:hypothetical protein [Candidatus Fermentibacteria bacterium]